MKCKIRAISSLAVTASLLSTLSPSSAYAMMNETGKSNVIESHSGNNTVETTNSDNNSNANENTSNDNLSSNEENPNYLLVTAIVEGKLDNLKDLINKDRELVNYVDDVGYSMLQYAVMFDQSEIVEFLISYGADLDFLNRDKQTALQIAKSSNLKDIENMIASTMFFQVIEKHDLKQIQDLVAKYNFLINYVNAEGSSALHEAVKVGDSGVVSFLIDNGANVEAKDENGQTPLHLMTNLNNLNEDIMMQMIFAAQDPSSYVNDADNELRTALHLSSIRCNKDRVGFLLQCGANKDAKDKYGKTALDYVLNVLDPSQSKLNSSVVKKDINFGKTTVDNSEKLDAKVVTEFFQAIKKHNLNQIQDLVARYNFLINCVDNENSSALHEAVKAGDPNVVGFLIDNGANVEAKDKNGQTPLHLMTNLNNLNENIMMQMIFAAQDPSSYVNNADNELRTALHLSSLNNNIDYVKLLVRYGANINVLDKYEKAPLNYALAVTDFFYAIGSKNLMEVKTLVKQYNFLINCVNDKKSSALHAAVEVGDPGVVNFLIDNGANVEAKDKNGQTPLHLMMKLNNLNEVTMQKMINAAKKFFPYVNDVDNNNLTALHFAVHNKNKQYVTILLENGADQRVLEKDRGTSPSNFFLSTETLETILRALGVNVFHERIGACCALINSCNEKEVRKSLFKDFCAVIEEKEDIFPSFFGFSLEEKPFNDISAETLINSISDETFEEIAPSLLALCSSMLKQQRPLNNNSAFALCSSILKRQAKFGGSFEEALSLCVLFSSMPLSKQQG